MNLPLFCRFAFLSACLPLFLARAVGMDGRIRFTNQHADLRLAHQPAGTNLFTLLVRDSDGGTNYAATNVVLVVREAAKLTMPDGFPELGAAGDDVWVLPQSQGPGLLYLGISAEGLPPGLLSDRPEVRVTRLDAPGHFAVWQADAFAGLRFAVNSRDGITEADRFTPLVGSHEHYNWGFSTNGHFTVWLQARATVAGTNAWSPETPFLFAVEPVPAVTPFQEWQAEQWPSLTDLAVIGPDADPDGDGLSNLAEFAHGLNPKAADPIQPVAVTLQTREGNLTGAFTYRRAKRATDVGFAVEAASSPSGPWQPLVIPDGLDDDGEAEWVTWLDSVAIADAPARFYRVRIALNPAAG